MSISFSESLPIADQLTIIFIFLHEPYVSLLCTQLKRNFFDDFLVFQFVLDPANASASMRLLVKYTTGEGSANIEKLEKKQF